MNKTGCGRAPGAAGELVQGQFPTGQDFLISLPVDLWSTARITLDAKEQGFTINDSSRTKTHQAARLLFEHLGAQHGGGHIEISSEIPVGKGMASSTADITAASLALGDAMDIMIRPDTIASIAKQIEPSDGIMYPGLVCFDHIRCMLIEELGDVPPLDILIVDHGGKIDTLAFNQRLKNYTLADIQQLSEAYELAQSGIQDQDLTKVGKAGLISAQVNQRILQKPELKTMVTLASKYDAIGLCIGHSGTIVCVLFDREHRSQLDRMQTALLTHWKGSIDTIVTRTTSSTIQFKGQR